VFGIKHNLLLSTMETKIIGDAGEAFRKVLVERGLIEEDAPVDIHFHKSPGDEEEIKSSKFDTYLNWRMKE